MIVRYRTWYWSARQLERLREPCVGSEKLQAVESGTKSAAGSDTAVAVQTLSMPYPPAEPRSGQVAEIAASSHTTGVPALGCPYVYPRLARAAAALQIKSHTH